MGRRYSTDGQRAVGSSSQTCLTLISASTIRPVLYEIVVGSTATPADNAIEWIWQRFTAVGSAGAAVTPFALDPNDPAALATSGENHSSEPTYTANAILLRFAQNQRATIRWVASAGGGLRAPATANNGIGARPDHASFTGNVECTHHHEE